MLCQTLGHVLEIQHIRQTQSKLSWDFASIGGDRQEITIPYKHCNKGVRGMCRGPRMKNILGSTDQGYSPCGKCRRKERYCQFLRKAQKFSRLQRGRESWAEQYDRSTVDHAQGCPGICHHGAIAGQQGAYPWDRGEVSRGGRTEHQGVVRSNEQYLRPAAWVYLKIIME